MYHSSAARLAMGRRGKVEKAATSEQADRLFVQKYMNGEVL